jgi:hypothetical protein
MADPHDTPGELPTIRDEAADSPMWLPALGLALLLVGTALIAWRARTVDEVAEPDVAQPAEADEAVEAEPAADPAAPE